MICPARSTKWYVAIGKNSQGHFRFDAGSDENFEFYSQFLRARGYEVIAEKRELDDSEMDRIMGFNLQKEKVGPPHLENLVIALNQGLNQDLQTALDELYARISQNTE